MTLDSAADIRWLFETNALKVAPADNPFWYTSGLIGPYYINTHFLCGGEKRANEVLSLIDERSVDRATFPAWMLEILQAECRNYPIFRSVSRALAQLAEANCSLSELTHVSGGERRDWFFAPIVAELLAKPCLYIYNDLSVYDSSGAQVDDLSGAKVLNVADLLTVGSSYVKKWVPALEALGAKLYSSIHAVDRRQMGVENLNEVGVKETASLFNINCDLFDEALKGNLITADQHKLITRYLDDAFTSMRDFLRTHPEFIERAKAADAKTQGRLQLMLDGNLYKL